MISAKEATKKTTAARKAATRKKTAKEQAEERRKKIATKYAIRTIFPEFLKDLEKDILSATKAGQTSIRRVAPGGDDAKVVADKCQSRLVKLGYNVGINREWIEAYAGSADDGFAYGHDAYDQWTVTISWSKS